jgi:two-component sensor histidine kinase
MNALTVPALFLPRRNLDHSMPRTSAGPDDHVTRLLEYQRALAGFSRVAGETLPLERLLHHVAAQVSRVTHIKHAKVLRYRSDRADLHIVAGVRWKPGVVGVTSLPLDQTSPPGRCLQTATPVVIEDLPNDPEYRMSSLLREHGIVSVANVPVRVDGRVWGVLEVDAETPRSFDEGDVGFLTTMANMLGMAIQRTEAEQSLLDSLAESAQAEQRSEVLLRELQHRVKNNFQVIISFLTLQRRHVSTPDDRSRFTSVIDRIHAIALAHDQLTFRNDAGQVEFCDYLHALCANIDPHLDGIAIEVEARRILLPLDRAVPAGLIVNELVTNSLKYAFDDTGGAIRVTFTVEADLGEACITVEDNGRGMGKSPTKPSKEARRGPAKGGGLGMTLVDAFVVQLDGHLETVEVDKGTCIRVTFPTAV